MPGMFIVPSSPARGRAPRSGAVRAKPDLWRALRDR